MAAIHRYRERTLVETYEDWQSTYQCNGTDASSPKTKDLTTETCSDYVTSNYAKKIADGAIINNPCRYTRNTYTSGGGSEEHKYKTGCPSYADYKVTGPITIWRSDSVPDFWGDLSELIDLNSVSNMSRAKQIALSYIDNTPYAFGEDALELKETLRFIKNPVASLYGLSKEFRNLYLRRKRKLKIKKRDTKRLLEAQASVYLQYQFALSPLIRSVSDILEVYSNTPKTRSPRLTARGILTGSQTESGNKVYSTRTFSREIAVTEEWKASILYEVSNPIDDWKYRLGFRVKDWPTTLWQVVPLSFMVDRVYDVTSFSKGVINLLDPNVRILAASSRTKSEWVKTHKFESQSRANWVDTILGDTVIDKEFVYDRKVWNPSVSDTVPEISLSTLTDSASKIADLSELTIANFTRL